MQELQTKHLKDGKKLVFFSKNVFNKISVAYPQNLETLKYLKKTQSK